MNHQGSCLETADDEAVLEVIGLEDQGCQLLIRNQSALSNRIYPTLIDIHNKVGQDFVVIGSWPAQQFAYTCKENENVGPDLECLVANDIDCFFRNAEDSPFAMEGAPEKEMINGNEVNFVKVCHFNIDGLLDNNNINATAFAIGVSKTNGRLSFKFKVSQHFWRWFLSPHHILSAVQPRQAKKRTLV
jgi:hypothetical protein